MPRFLLFSDVHLHPWVNIPLTHQLSCLLNITRYASANNIKSLLFCGDLFHSHSSINTHVMWVWNQFLQEVKALNLSLTGISGNHDHYLKNGTVTALDAIRLLPKGSLLGPGDIVEVDGVPVKGYEYIDDKEDLKLLLQTDKDFPSNCILLMHQGVQGVELNSKGFTLNEGLSSDLIPQNVLHCFAGHYHTNRQVSSNLTIPGALMQHGFGDSYDSRGFLDITVDNGIKIKRVLNSVNEFETVSFPLLEQGKYSPQSLNIKVTDVPSATAVLDSSLTFNGHIIWEYKTNKATSPEVIKSESFSTVDFFEDYVKSRDLTPEQIRIGKEIIYGRS